MIYRLKKISQWMGFICIINGLLVPAAHADDTALLTLIEQHTNNILTAVNTLPTYIANMTTYITNMQTNDETTETSNMSTNFATLGTLLSQDISLQNINQKTTQQLLADQLGQYQYNVPVSVGDLSAASGNQAKILTYLPNVNDLSYMTLLNMPPVTKGKVTALGYIENVGGIKLPHAMPGATWGGSADDQTRYANYYNTVMSVESYSSYILAMLANDYTNGNSVQSQLVSQASSSDWLAKVTSNEMGVVVRQMLMFQSQAYVVLTQIAQTQKQLLMAQVMTNTLLIANNQMNESQLVYKAQKAQPTH